MGALDQLEKGNKNHTRNEVLLEALVLDEDGGQHMVVNQENDKENQQRDPRFGERMPNPC